MPAVLDVVFERARQAIVSKSLAQLYNRNKPGRLGQLVRYMPQLTSFLVCWLIVVRTGALPALQLVNVIRHGVYITSRGIVMAAPRNNLRSMKPTESGLDHAAF